MSRYNVAQDTQQTSIRVPQVQRSITDITCAIEDQQKIIEELCNKLSCVLSQSKDEIKASTQEPKEVLVGLADSLRDRFIQLKVNNQKLNGIIQYLEL